MGTVLGNCPNCGISLEGEPTLGFIEYAPGKGVSVCAGCISMPGCLDEDLVGNNLLKLGWSSVDVELVKKEILRRRITELRSEN